MAIDIFPEVYNTTPSERLGVSRMVATVVLVSSGNGHIAEAAGIVTYAKTGELETQAREILKDIKNTITRLGS